jgi:hypothetical protein
MCIAPKRVSVCSFPLHTVTSSHLMASGRNETGTRGIPVYPRNVKVLDLVRKGILIRSQSKMHDSEGGDILEQCGQDLNGMGW